MVHMRMGQQHIVHTGLLYRELCIFKHIRSLFHSVIHQNAFVPNFNAMAASGYLVVCTNKCKLHCNPTFSSDFTVLLHCNFFTGGGQEEVYAKVPPATSG